ncbi:formyltetrahydrofolate deformylase [Verrucomicrobiales bacterium]|nr:formyltetrahydrofolate deformylase [Verrucomicrobiales bacterium]MDA9923352.1 formyltetrahydrofolate deformylase [Verrucomicrobiales bacterium]MDB2496216.1 formyltetrahydrofolate deformylase [Verrucomicrobiales bacterium]
MSTHSQDSSTAILLVSCPDQPGIVASVSDFLFQNKGNIVDVDQHVDQEGGVFFMRVEWEIEGFSVAPDQIEEAIAPLAEKFSMTWSLYFTEVVPRVALFITRDNHCVYDLLSRHESGELRMEVPLIVSNREDLQPVADRFSIPFHFLPITKETKAEQEKKEIQLLRDHEIDVVVLARYMQILSPLMTEAFPNRIINIHHSFLPAFPGARPYHSAHKRGVKLVGATSHYVTEDLDEGPIIAQGVTPVSHSDTVHDFVRKGRALEQSVLSRAVWLHLNRRTLVHANRTVVFG